RVMLTLKPPDLKRFRALDKEAAQRIERHEREIRRAERTLLAAKMLVGILLLLAVTLIYIRIDDWTRRAYTRWLQATALVLLACTSIGLWMLPQKMWVVVGGGGWGMYCVPMGLVSVRRAGNVNIR